MKAIITPKKLSGDITPPASKSQAHRLMIAAALSEGTSVISRLSRSQDIDATLSCMTALGAKGQWLGEETLRLTGGKAEKDSVLDCGESGSTLRFLIPIALAVQGKGTFKGRGRLMQRPQEPYFEIFREKGIAYTQEGDTLTVEGILTPGIYRLPGNVSSQFITGLLYALPLLPGDSEIELTTALESKGYVDMTLNALRAFGVTAEVTDRGYKVPGNQKYIARDMAVESDYSQAGFFFAAKGCGSELNILGLNKQSAQGDRIVEAYMALLDGDGDVTLDVRECPDLVPPLAARAALRKGKTYIVNAARLRIKESDRLRSVTDVLSKLGADILEEPEGLTITGKDRLAGGEVDAWGDHRIAMMAAVAAIGCEKEVILTGAENVRKSYPTFWEDYESLGGQIRQL